MKKHIHSRYFVAIAIFSFYFIPLFFYGMYTSAEKVWIGAGLGLLITSLGTALLYLFILNWQREIEILLQSNIHSEAIPASTDPLVTSAEFDPLKGSPLAQSQTTQEAVLEELAQKTDQLQKMDKEWHQLTAQNEKFRQDVESYRIRVEDAANKDSLHNEYLMTISKQKDLLEEQEQQILKLDARVRELTYEIKTLLQVNEYTKEGKNHIERDLGFVERAIPEPLNSSKYISHHSPQMISSTSQAKSIVPPIIEANLQLKRCIDIAQKMVGTSSFGMEASRFRDLSVNSYSIDLRRLFDSLRSENSNGIILYSQKEEKLLFVSSQIKNLLGWSPEKLIQDFPHLIIDGLDEWKKGLSQLSSKNEVQFILKMKAKAGQDTPLHCYIGVIPTGIFKGHVIGVLTPKEKIKSALF